MHEALKEESYRANILLPKFGIVNLTFGNVSVGDRKNGLVAIKPSGVSYAELQPKHIVLVDMDGKKIEGDLNPSSDTPTHCCLYRHFPEIVSVVHTHSKFATGFAQAGMPIPCLGTTHADYFCGEIPVTRKMKPKEIGGAYELETGNVIVERFRNLRYQDVPAVLVHSHGPFAWGPGGEKAVENAFAMELVAEMAYYALTLKSEPPYIQRELLEKHFYRKHGKNAYYGQKTKE
ncbi:MAG: L-ribulose-5-phosphate 4-epimerase AraD [Chitinispirillaceae bacterium]|nr:L-ribulose-5-phosphate 4-epimerase AraD [Chitinispirillaceae bacterium]